MRADLYSSAIGITLAVFGTVETPYREHNPGSRARLPKRAAGIRPPTSNEAAAAILASIENGRRTIGKPSIFRLLFLLKALFPTQTEALMCS